MYGDQSQKLVATAPSVGSKGLVGVAGCGPGGPQTLINRVIFRRVPDGRWLWVIRNSRGTYERFGAWSDLPFAAGRRIWRWKWVQVTRTTGFYITEWAPEERPVDVGAFSVPKTIHNCLWRVAEEVAGKLPPRAYDTARRLDAFETREERQLMGKPWTENSCFYLSLFHLARKTATKEWLLSFDWGPAVDEQMHDLCRGWAIREGRAIKLNEVRREGTAASDVTVRIFVPMGKEIGADSDTVIIMKTSPDNAKKVQGHAVPVRGDSPFNQFSWPLQLGFKGKPKDCEIEVVNPSKKSGASEPEEDEPAPKADKGKERAPNKKKWVPVDSLTPAELDEALAKFEQLENPMKPEPAEATSSATDIVVAEVIEEELAKVDLKALAASMDKAFEAGGGCSGEKSSGDEIPKFTCVDCNKVVDRWADLIRPCGRCEDCQKLLHKRQAPKVDQHGPHPAPDVVQSTPADAVLQPKDRVKPPPVTKDYWQVCREAEREPAGVQTQTGQAIATECQQVNFDKEYDWLRDAGQLGGQVPTFAGMVMQAPIDVRWVSGWWFDEGQEYTCGDWVRGYLRKPVICSATMDMVTEWGVKPLFLPVRERDGLRFTTNGVVTNGARSAQTFKAGSVLKVRWQSFVAESVNVTIQGVTVEMLRLRRLESGTLRSVIGGRFFLGKARLSSYEPTAGRIEAKVFNACKWQGAVKTEKDPLAQGFLQIARAQELGKAKIADPDTVVPLIRRLAEAYEKPDDVSGPFEWGFCYSGCGKERPSKFKGRICPNCTGTNTTLGQWVADGYQVCSAANPVRYPGVVWTKKQHPPIKPDAATIATYGVEYVVTKRVAGEEVVVPEEELLNAPVSEGKGPRLGGIGLDGAIPFVTANGIRPLVEAVKYRVFKDLNADQSKPKRVVDVEAFQRTTHLLDTFLPHLTRCEVVRRRDGLFLDMLEWVNTMNNGRRRRALMKALMELRANGFLEPHDWNIIKPFVKSENLPYFKSVKDWQWGRKISRDGFVYVPRLIQAPSDYSHLVAGPYLKPMISGLKDDWGPDNWIFYASVNPSKLDKWLSRIADCQSYFWSDYTAFDATYSPEAWALIETLYKRCMPEASGEFWRILEAWRTPQGRVTHRASGYTLKYNARVCNASGRDDTALANAVLNGLVLGMSFAAALAGKDLLEVQPADIEAAKALVSISIVGDDSLVGCNFDVDQYKDEIERNIRRFGLVAKVETSHWVGDVTFLGMMPYPVIGGGLQWGPTIGRRFYKAFWQADPVGSLPAWTRGVAQQLLLCRNVPILYEAAEQVDYLLRGHKVTRQQVDRNRVWASRTDETKHYSVECFDWLARRYEASGLTPDMIKRDIAVIRTVKKLPCVVQLESLERILLQDDL